MPGWLKLRSPISQNNILCSLAAGLMASRKLISAPHPAAMTTPVRSTFRGFQPAPEPENTNTMNMVSNAPKQAPRVSHTPASPMLIASNANTEAPPEIPRI